MNYQDTFSQRTFNHNWIIAVRSTRCVILDLCRSQHKGNSSSSVWSSIHQCYSLDGIVCVCGSSSPRGNMCRFWILFQISPDNYLLPGSMLTFLPFWDLLTSLWSCLYLGCHFRLSTEPPPCRSPFPATQTHADPHIPPCTSTLCVHASVCDCA